MAIGYRITTIIVLIPGIGIIVFKSEQLEQEAAGKHEISGMQ